MKVDVLYDSGGTDQVRVVALRVDPEIPGEPTGLLRSEGVWHGAGVWSGPVERFRAALHRWPVEADSHRAALVQALGLTLRTDANAPEARRTLVMGILNVTPDSFFDGGRYTDVRQALVGARRMVADGADIIDVGGESTRPNADAVPVEEETRRVVPVVRALSQELSVPISIDTTKSRVAEAALAAGATIVNDISGLAFDPRMASVVAHADASLVVMHIKGTPTTMQRNPVYQDVVAEVRAYLEASCERAIAAGVRPDRLWIDPGFGFGKALQHNLELLRCLRSLRSLGFPILVGTSNKSMIGQVLGVDVTDRVEGTAATVAIAIAHGADAVRVHDVRVMRRVADMTDAVVRLGAGSAQASY